MTREEKAVYEFEDILGELGSTVEVTEDLKEACRTAIETLKPKEGHWIKEKSLHGWDGKSYQCSVCCRSIHIDPEVEDLTDYPYCHCGAKMVELQEGSDQE